MRRDYLGSCRACEEGKEVHLTSVELLLRLYPYGGFDAGNMKIASYRPTIKTWLYNMIQ